MALAVRRGRGGSVPGASPRVFTWGAGSPQPMLQALEGEPDGVDEVDAGAHVGVAELAAEPIVPGRGGDFIRNSLRRFLPDQGFGE